MGPSQLWIFTIWALLHSSLSLPVDSHDHNELQQEVNNLKNELKHLFESINELSRSYNEENDDDGGDGDNSQACSSKECIATSHRLFQNMDLNAKPCEDFNQFACGNFIKETLIPEDKGQLNSLNGAALDRGRAL